MLDHAARQPLIGRKRDLAQLYALAVDPETRLITIAGVGGIGKTRLALELQSTLRDEFADGVHFVDLVSVRDPWLMAEEVASSLQIPATDSDHAREALFEHFASREALIVLDNMEHLLEATPFVDELLGHCAGLVIVATSRERLDLPFEQVFELMPLPTPSQHLQATLDEVSSSESVQLFVQRATASDRAFQLTTDSAGDVAAICRRLDGLPLAIELAASRVAEIPPRLILRNFVRILPFLERSSHDPNARHRTMVDAIAWSVDLLNPEERSIFSRLSIFESPFTIESAIAVAMDGGSTPSGSDPAEAATIETVRRLSSLVNKHLLLRHDWDGQDPRFSMLQTIREYGLELLRGNTEESVIRARHLAYFTQLAYQYRIKLLGPEPLIWIKRYERDFAEFRSALRWSIQERIEDGLAAIVLCNNMAHFWLWRGHIREALRTYEAAMAGAAQTPNPDLALGYMQLGHFSQQDHERAHRYYTQSYNIYLELNDPKGIANLLTCLATITEIKGDYARARTYLEDAIRRFDAMGNDSGKAQCLYELGRIQALEGDYANGKKHLDEARSIFESLGNAGNTIFTISEMGRVYRLEGRLEEARQLQRWSYDRFKDEELHNGIIDSRCELGRIALAEGNLAEAAASFHEAIQLLLVRDALSTHMAVLLIGMSAVASRSNELETSVKLLAVIRRWSEALRFQPTPDEVALIETTRAQSLSSLGQAAFDTAWNGGDLLKIEEAAQLALTISPPEHIPVTAPVDAATPQRFKLTKQELNVLCKLATGAKNRQIADEFFISERTVAVHVQNILRKLDAENRTRASAIAYLAGLCPPGD